MQSRAGLWVVVMSLLAPPIAFGSPQSIHLLEQGIADLQDQRYGQALENFESAARVDPADMQAHFFIGCALNRMDQHDAALRNLDQAAESGVRHSDLHFEKGWSLLGLARWQEAIEQLNEYEKTNPGRGQTSEFLGRAYLALGEYEKAQEAFALAVRRDPNLAPTVRLYRALLEQ